MLKNKRLASGLLAVPLVTILLIAGCTVDSPKPSESPTSAPSISAPANPTASPAPTATEAPPAPEPEVTVGATVDAATATEMNSDSKGQYRGYAMPDGSHIVVDRTAPLPEVVQQDVNNKGAANANAHPVDDGTNGFLRDRETMIRDIGANTGKRVIALLRMDGYDYDGNLTTKYFFNGAFNPNQAYGSAAEARAAADAWVASQSNPNAYVIVMPE